jgi:endonuclease/exonuclease/phosphatase family metal-dependent hydrolase
MKLIQINAWLGRLNGPLVRFIETEQPDIICMQEAFRPNEGGMPGFADQYNFLNQVVSKGGFTYQSFADNWGFTMTDQVIVEGNVILSKFPVSDEQSFHTHQEYHVRQKASDARPNTRVWQACTVTLPDGRKLSIANYHGYLDGPHDFGTEVTVETMKKAKTGVAALGKPVIFCGDFNAWPSSPAIKLLDDLGLRNLTIENGVKTTISEAHQAPTEDRARATCDYILVSPEIQVKSFKVADEVVSDHKALVLEFDF